MATVQEEYRKIQTSGKRPIPGQSLSNDPENPAPFEKAPVFTSVHAASEYLWESFIEPETYVNLMQTISEGVPLMDIAQMILFAEFQKGSWNPDLMLMLFEPVAYMLMALAERLDLDIVIYEGEDEDAEKEADVLGAKFEESKIEDMKKAARAGRVPEGTLTNKMKAELEQLPELPSLMAKVPVEEEEPALQPPSLMSPPIPAGV